MNYRTLLFSYPGEESYEAATASFRVTTDGIAFYKPLQIGGKEITGMKYVGEDENMVLTFTDEATGATMHDTWPALSELFFSGKWYFAKSLMMITVRACGRQLSTSYMQIPMVIMIFTGLIWEYIQDYTDSVCTT